MRSGDEVEMGGGYMIPGGVLDCLPLHTREPQFRGLEPLFLRSPDMIQYCVFLKAQKRRKAPAGPSQAYRKPFGVSNKQGVETNLFA